MDTNQLLALSPSTLRRAAEIKEQIDSLQDELDTLLSGHETKSTAAPRSGGKGRGMSAAGRARIAAAARARWAKVRAAKGGDQTQSKDGSKRRKMSAAARKKIAEAAKARWARFRAQKGQ